MKLLIKPDCWKCRLEDCPPGFFVFEKELCFKTEYGKDEVFCSSGEIFWGGAKTKEERLKLIVQPCVAVWEEDN